MSSNGGWPKCAEELIQHCGMCVTCLLFMFCLLTLLQDLENKGYICPNCKATFTTLEADRLMDFSRGGFYCDICSTSPGGPHEVIMNEDAESVRGSRDRMERFMKQTSFIQEGLKKSETMVLPACVYANSQTGTLFKSLVIVDSTSRCGSRTTSPSPKSRSKLSRAG